MQNKTKVLFACSVLSLMSSVCFANSLSESKEINTTQLAVGYYKSLTKKPDTRPLILTNEGNGRWSFLENIPLLSDQYVHYIFAADCVGSNCIVGGNYYTEADDYNFILLRSNDAGKNWVYVNNISGFPPLMGDTSVQEINCDDSVCLASVGYSPTRNVMDSRSILLRSQDNGLSWTSIYSIENAPTNSNFYIYSTKCFEPVCIGIYGYIYNEGNDYSVDRPIISMDKGKTWKYVKDIENLPAYKELKFGNLICRNNDCIAAGSYLPSDEEKYENVKPIIIKSNDKGQHWAVQNIKNIPIFAQGYISSLTYSKHKWFAVVGYVRKTETGNDSPLLLVSEDNGKNWEPVAGISGSKYNIKTIYCRKNDCIAGGSHHDNHAIPLLLTSHDGGKSFKVIQNIQGFPNKYHGPSIKDISCRGPICSAIGYFEDMYESKYPPYILFSLDKGDYWQYVEIKDLPKDLQSGTIETITH